MYDAIVVGARCAGAATALLMARSGHRVLLVDRASFPSDTLCTNQLTVPAVALLTRWGLLERVVGSCPPAHGSAVRAGGRTVDVPNPVVGGAAVSYGPRRLVLDACLVDAARDAGVELREQCVVRDLVWEADRVVGVVAQGPDGHSVCELGRVVIGADGRQSLVARVAQAATIEERPASACCYYAYWSDTGGTCPQWHADAGSAVGLYPTSGGLAAVVVRLPVAEWARFKRAPEEVHRSVVERFPAVVGRLSARRRQSRFFGTADLGGVVRQSSGPGWMLVGDAAHHDDPLLWPGISASFIDAHVAAVSLQDHLSGRMPPSSDEAPSARRRRRAWAETRALEGEMDVHSGLLEAWAAVIDHAQRATADSVSALLATR